MQPPYAVSSTPDLNNGTPTLKAASDIEFPEYEVNISGIKLSSPYSFDFSDLVKELKSSGMNTIFLNVDTNDVGKYERFVRKAHMEGISVHAVLFENFNSSEKGAYKACQDSLNAVLDYNNKSLAPFDGIDIYIKPSDKEGSEDTIDYKILLETAYQKVGKNISVSASIPPNYPTSEIDKIAPSVDFFIVRAYSESIEELSYASSIVDAISLQTMEIRSAGSKELIEVSVDEGFKDKVSIQKLFAALADYYSNDSAFLGVSTSNYDAYACLPVKADLEKAYPEKKESYNYLILGFWALLAIVILLGAYDHFKLKRD